MYLKVKLYVHVFSKSAGVVIPECFGISKSLGIQREGRLNQIVIHCHLSHSVSFNVSLNDIKCHAVPFKSFAMLVESLTLTDMLTGGGEGEPGMKAILYLLRRNHYLQKI